MKRRARRFSSVLALALLPAVWACGRDDEAEVETLPGSEVAVEAVRVTDVELGRAIGPDNRVTDDAETDDFRPSDTVYASVATEGTATGSSLTARWTYQDGQVVDETTQTISPTGPTVTEFHISMPGGLPAGNYQVEILLNGRSVERKDFEVK
jgi:hypothetical protein